MTSKKPNPQRDALIEETLQQLRRQLEEQLPDDTATFAQIEAAAGRVGRNIAEDIKRRLHSEHTPSPTKKED